MVTGTLALDGCNVTSGTAMRGGYVVLEARHWPRDAPRPNFYGLGLKGSGLGLKMPRGQTFMALVSKVQDLALRRPEAKFLWP